MIVTSNSCEKTMEIGETFAKKLVAGDIIALIGDLGAGKTHFVKGMAKSFGVDVHEVTSPTFALLNIYEGIKVELYHFDWYRLENYEEFEGIGALEYLYGSGISAIEWYDSKFHEIENIKEVKFTSIDEKTREISLPLDI
jgi:tRNA threonylcarbamoyladenosine biosynthesis protein TsaE